MRQNTRAKAENQARVDIANAKYQGDVGEKEKDRDTRIRTSKFEAEAVDFENKRNVEIADSNAKYLVAKAEFDRQTQVAKIESDKAAEIRDTELQKEVENRKIAQETERIRSELFSKAVVEAESKERSADAELYQKQKDAAGILAVFNAQADGLKNLMSVTSDPNTILQYMMIDKDMYQKMAAENAKAIQGLQPKITHWVTGESAGDPITNLMQKTSSIDSDY